jgi:ABC-2 type transport system permease protein
VVEQMTQVRFSELNLAEDVPLHPPPWALQVYLLTNRVAIDALRNPVLVLNLILALLFLVVYDGTMGGLGLVVDITGGNYYFILPAAILAASVGGGAAGLLLVSDIRSGYLYRQLTMPIKRSALITSLVLVSAFQVTLQASVVIAVALVLGADPQTGFPGLIGVLALAFVWGGGFAAYSIAVAILTQDMQMTSAANLIFIPLIFLSPLLVPYAYLKPWMQLAATVNPTRYVMEGMRSLLIAGWNSRLLLEALAASLAFGIAMGVAALVVIRMRLLDIDR